MRPSPRDLRFADRRWNSGLARVFLHIVEFLFRVFESFLFVRDLLFVLGVLLIPVCGVAQAAAGVAVHGSGANLIFALQHVEFALGHIDLLFLRSEFLAPLFPGGFLAGIVLGWL